MSTTMDSGSVMLRTEPMVPFSALFIGCRPWGAVVFVEVVVQLDLAALVHFDELVEVRAGAEHPPRDRLVGPHAVLALYLVHVVPHVADRRLIISADTGNCRPACGPLHKLSYLLLCQADSAERAAIGELRGVITSQNGTAPKPRWFIASLLYAKRELSLPTVAAFGGPSPVSGVFDLAVSLW